MKALYFHKQQKNKTFLLEKSCFPADLHFPGTEVTGNIKKMRVLSS